jgi:hypothetical protein
MTSKRAQCLEFGEFQNGFKWASQRVNSISSQQMIVLAAVASEATAQRPNQIDPKEQLPADQHYSPFLRVLHTKLHKLKA